MNSSTSLTRCLSHRIAAVAAANESSAQHAGITAALLALLMLGTPPVEAEQPPPAQVHFAEPVSGARVTEYQVELPTNRSETRTFAIPEDCPEVMRCVDEGAVYRSTIIDRRLWQKVDADCRFYSFLYRHPQQVLEDYVSSYDFRNARLSDLPIDRRCADGGSPPDDGECNPSATDGFGMLRYFPLAAPPNASVGEHGAGSCEFRDGVFHGWLHVDADGLHCDAGPGAPTLRLIAVDYADINGDHYLDAVLRFVPIGPGATRSPLTLPLTRTIPEGPFSVPEPVADKMLPPIR